jgi:hypothetical protein
VTVPATDTLWRDLEPDQASDLRSLLEQQEGLATLGQLRLARVSQDALRWRLGRSWQLVLPRVVATTRAPLTRRQYLFAALLYAGPGAALSSSAAAGWYGVTAAAADRRVCVEVPWARAPGSCSYVLVRRTRHPDPAASQHRGLTLVNPGRAVAAAARDAPDLTSCRVLVIEAVQRGIVTVGQVRHEVELGDRRGTRWARQALDDAEAGAWSLPESDLLALLSTSRVLPPAWANPDLRAPDGRRLPHPDCWLDDVGLAVQVHSRRHHAGELQWEQTVMADGVFAEYGIPVIGVTPRSIATDPSGVLRRVEAAYRAAGRRPRPDVVAVPQYLLRSAPGPTRRPASSG